VVTWKINLKRHRLLHQRSWTEKENLPLEVRMRGLLSSPDYPTFGYSTFRFIRRAASERSILSTVNSACSGMDQLTGNDTVNLVNHAGDDDLEGDNKGPQKADRMSHTKGLNSVETALAYVE
jgi:hypothetical protein